MTLCLSVFLPCMTQRHLLSRLSLHRSLPPSNVQNTNNAQCSVLFICPKMHAQKLRGVQARPCSARGLGGTAQPRSLPDCTLPGQPEVRTLAEDHDDVSPAAVKLTHAHGTAETAKTASGTNRELGPTASFRVVMCHVHRSGSRVMWSTIARSCGRA